MGFWRDKVSGVGLGLCITGSAFGLFVYLLLRVHLVVDNKNTRTTIVFSAKLRVSSAKLPKFKPRTIPANM